MHVRLAEAFERAFQEGRPPNDQVIADLMTQAGAGRNGKTSRETIVRWRRMRPDVWNWATARVREVCELMKPLVDRRVTQLAIQGSVEHAKLFYQFVAKVGIPFDESVPGGGAVVYNILVQHPQLPHGGRLPALGAALPKPPAAVIVAAQPKNSIPTVSVR